MKLHDNKSGFSAIELILIVVVVAVLGVVGYNVYNRQQEKTNPDSTSQQASGQSATADDVKSAPSISSTADLDRAEQVLNQTDPASSNNSDTGQLDSQASAF